MIPHLAKLVAKKLAIYCMKYQRNLRTFVQRLAGLVKKKHTRVYRVDGLVKNVMIMSVLTLWMTPIGTLRSVRTLSRRAST